VTDLSLENVDFVDEEYDDTRYREFLNEEFGVCGHNTLVGHGKPRPRCGDYEGDIGCLDTEAHKFRLQLAGSVGVEEIYRRPVFHHCHRPACPKCYRAWMVHEAKRIAGRLAEASKRYGSVEHLSANVPPERYGMDFKAMRAFILKALKRRGVIGGCIIYHGFRENKFTRHWFFAPHWHCLGFLQGGYSCRGCSKRAFASRSVCAGCHGFEAHTRECFNVDGTIVKVAVDDKGEAGERRSVFQSAKYQLSHASIRTDCVRPQVVTWFGTCSYRKLKFVYVSEKPVCAICGGQLRGVRYSGSKHFCVDVDSPDFKFESVEVLREDGRVVWEYLPESDSGGSGSYGGRRVE